MSSCVLVSHPSVGGGVGDWVIMPYSDVIVRWDWVITQCSDERVRWDWVITQCSDVRERGGLGKSTVQ